MSDYDFLELKSNILEIKSMLNLFLPSKMTLSFIVDTTGKSRQTITQYLQNNFEPKVDFWKENGKIHVSQATAFKLLRRYKR